MRGVSILMHYLYNFNSQCAVYMAAHVLQGSIICLGGARAQCWPGDSHSHNS